MGQKLKIWATMTSIVLLSGMLGFGFSAYAQESPADLPPQSDAGQAQGCEESGDRSNERASAAARNPHCEEEPPAFNICDTNEDGEISRAEVSAFTGLTGTDLDIVMLTATGAVDGIIDTDQELIDLNGSIDPPCI